MGATRSQRTERLAETLRTYGWPPLMPTAVAERYANASRWTLRRAVAAGHLRIAGKRGRSWIWAREDLDRWMLGHKFGPETEQAK